MLPSQHALAITIKTLLRPTTFSSPPSISLLQILLQQFRRFMTSTRAEMTQRLLEYLNAQIPTQLPTTLLEKFFENLRCAEAVPVTALDNINECEIRHLCAYIKADLLNVVDRNRNIVNSKAIPAKSKAALPLPSVKQKPLYLTPSASSASTLLPAPFTKPIAPAPVQQPRSSSQPRLCRTKRSR